MHGNMNVKLVKTCRNSGFWIVETLRCNTRIVHKLVHSWTLPIPQLSVSLIWRHMVSKTDTIIT
jgi:hypothetical protein